MEKKSGGRIQPGRMNRLRSGIWMVWKRPPCRRAMGEWCDGALYPAWRIRTERSVSPFPVNAAVQREPCSERIETLPRSRLAVGERAEKLGCKHRAVGIRDDADPGVGVFGGFHRRVMIR